MQQARLRLAPAALALAALTACTAAKTEPAASLAAPQDVAVEVRPATAAIGLGGTVQFAAAVTGTINTAVTWQVQEGSGGTVDAAGLYTAPAAAGTYHVVARSVADGSRAASATVTVQPVTPIAVTISPGSPTVAAGATQAFTATVTGTTDGAVTWSVREATGCGTISAAGLYTAPPAAASCHVVAVSAADGATSGVATVTVTAPPAVTVSISPSAPSLDACRTQTFTATVTGAADTSVSWSIQEAAGGTVTAGGTYTAPDTAGTYHLVATSRAAPGSSATVPIAVAERVLAIAIDPPTVTVLPNGTAQFTARVTTSCGVFAAKQTVAMAR